MGYSVYELFADAKNTMKAAHFKKTFSVKNVRVHFIGAWLVTIAPHEPRSASLTRFYRDSVSSIGLVRGSELPLTDECGHVCHFRHALALDECRVKFMPECLARPGKRLPPNAKEVWFPGSHSDV